MFKNSLLLIGVITALSGAAVAPHMSHATAQHSEPSRPTEVQSPKLPPQSGSAQKTDGASAVQPINPSALAPLINEERYWFEREMMGIRRPIWE